MKKLRVNEVFVPINYKDDEITKALSWRLNLHRAFVKDWVISKKSIDARKKNEIRYVMSVDVNVADGYILKDKKTIVVVDKDYIIPKTTQLCKRPVVVGFGPAGIFAALILAECGQNPIVLERGSCVEERQKETENFFKNRVLNTESNVQFGEGGAGTFSDGKLGTGINDVRIRKVFAEFVKAGAPKEILYEAKPHVGTDKLPSTVKNLREKIKSLGGEVHFNTKMTEIISDNGKITAVKAVNNGKEMLFETNDVILALGHSARDSFEMLHDKKIMLEQKAFSIGARIEHRAEIINQSQYGAYHKILPTADYKLFTHLLNGRTVYSFCMCPGGYVVGATSVENAVTTNGMSKFARDAENSNAGILVSVKPEDFPDEHVLSGMRMQEEIEKKAFDMAGKNYNAPCQRVEDFFVGKESKSFGDVKPSYEPGVSCCDFRKLFPEFISDSMKYGIKAFGNRIKGFDSPDAVLTGPETRSSSPIRIVRNQELQSPTLVGLYPCGEGAGYAGGITSAAVDGIRCAEAVMKISSK